MKNMKIFAFSDEANASVDLQISALLRNKMQGMEIRNVDGTNVSDISLDEARLVRSKLDAAGLSVWSIGSPIGKIGIHDDFAPHVDKLLHTLEVAHILGAENLRMFSFFMPENADPADFKNEVIDRLGIMCERAEGSGITLCHENEKGIYGDTAERCLDVQQALPSLSAVFDMANFVQCGVDTLEAWDMLHPYVKYLHIKDALADGSVVPAGKGIGNVPAILSRYIAQGGSVLTLEPHLTVFEGLGALENDGKRSAVGEVYSYPTADAAFDAAASALRALL